MYNGIVNIVEGFSLAAIQAIHTQAVDMYQAPSQYTVVPTVYGYGTDTRAAYGDIGVDPIILHVDTLVAGVSNTDSTHGSFEWAITRTYPRIVVFDVSGVIETTVTDRYLLIRNQSSYLSIYGQTAPAPICINGCFTVAAHDVLFQHLAVRNQKLTVDGYALTPLSVSVYEGPNYNVVFDHCSTSWGTDENAGTWTYPPDNVGCTDITFSNCIHAEGIYNHATGFITSSENVSALGNLYAHNNNRHPFIKEGAQVAFFNNLVYNMTYRMAQVSGDYDYNAPAMLDFRGNVSIAGPNSGSAPTYPLVQINSDYAGKELQLYMVDNIRNEQTYPSFDVLNDGGISGYEWAQTPLLDLPSFCLPYSVEDTYNTVLTKAGSRPAERDTTDARIINEVQTLGGASQWSIPTLPTYEEVTEAFVPVANPHDMYDENYTNLEHQMHLLAQGVETVETYTVIPDLYGFGTDTRAAYGGSIDPIVLHVDTLVSGSSNTDSTHGSFKWCVQQNYPRIVVFDVSGVIDGVGNLDIFNPYMFIAGQTAPDHIVYNGSGFYIGTHDVVVQHMSFRNKSTADKDCITIYPYGSQNISNVVIDHVSGAWATDETLACSGSPSYSTIGCTISNCLFTDAIIHEGSSAGILTSSPEVSYIGNLMAHHNKRHPALNEGGEVVFTNNVIYNYGYAIAEFNGDTGNGVKAMWLTFEGNVVKSGTDSHAGRGLLLLDLHASDDTLSVSMSDNLHDGTLVTGADVDTSDYDYPWSEVTAKVVPNFTKLPASSISALVVVKAGSRPADRDSIDTDAINDYINGTGTHPTSTPSMPNYTETTEAFVPVDNPHDMYNENYTNLEHQLHLLAAAVE